MSASRYPDNNRYTARDRSPYRERRPSNFGAYPPRSSENPRPSTESGGLPARETPRGPKSLGDAPRGPAAGPLSGTPSAPRDGRGRAFAGRGEATSFRDAPPLSTGSAPPSHNSHNSWRADRDRDRDFDRRERRPTPPPRRSPVRDSRDARDQRDFGPRDLDVNRARRNSRDGPPSAGSTYSDPPLGSGSSYRGSGVARGRGGFAGRGRNVHDDRERFHDPRDRPPADRSYRPRSRTPPGRRERDARDDRDFDRRDRDDRRYAPREYDSYIGPAGAAKSGPRTLDTHRGSVQSDSRHLPNTPTGSAPHLSHHASPSDRLGSQADTYSRRSSLAIDPSAKDSRREPGKDEALLASRAEASRERYAPRASSPPASIPAFGSSVWRAPVPEAKASTAPVAPPKPSQFTPSATAASAATPPATAPVASATPTTPVVPPATLVPAAYNPTVAAPTIPTAPKSIIPPGLSTLPPTGPKADRVSDRLSNDVPRQESRTGPSAPARMDPPPNHSTNAPHVPDILELNSTASKSLFGHQVLTAAKALSISAPPPPPPPLSALSKSPPQGPAVRPRLPTAPQAVRANASPSMPRAQLTQYPTGDTLSGAVPPALGPRIGSGGFSSINTSPKSLPANIPTGPKADRAPMTSRPPLMYPPSDRPSFPTPRTPMGGGPKSMQWVRPGLIPSRGTIPSKREFPNDDRERGFGSAPKAPRLENSVFNTPPQREHQAKSVSPSFSRVSIDTERPRERASSAERPATSSPKPSSIDTRRYSDVIMTEPSPRTTKPPMSAASSVPEALQDSDDDLDLDEDDFAESEAKYNRERARLEAKRVDLAAPHLRTISPLQEIIMLACLTIDHLPQGTVKPRLPDELPSPIAQGTPRQPPVSLLAESTTAELPTPKAEDSEDVEMEERDERPAAPATMALRLRRETSADQETLPDLSSLPYLGSGPPTPLSDIGQDRPSLSDSVIAAMRDRLRKGLEPQLGPDETLQRYGAVYKQWRLSIRPWDDDREQDDQERQPSIEPTLKATTPDVQSATMTGLLDGSLAPTGRRGHSSRFATELDIEAVLKESLKTAEEERMGKKEKEPRKAMADPEKEASLPLELTEPEAQRRRFIDTNFRRKPGQGIFVFHYEPPEDDFTTEEHRVMVYNYKDQYAKKWGKLAEVLYKEVGTERTYKDCINHYYATKWGREYKGKIKGRRGGVRKRGGAVARNRGAIANMDRPDTQGEDGLPLPITETGRPRRLAAPTFGGTETDPDSTAATPTPGRARRQTDADGTQEKVGRRGKTAKEKPGRKAKNPPLAAAPTGSPAKSDPRKEKGLGVKLEDEFVKRSLAGDLSMPIHASLVEEQMLMAGDSQLHSGLPGSILDRPKTQAGARPGPSSYWSVSELQDFDKNVAHFGTDWQAIATHMNTKTHTMIKNQYLRFIESGRADLERMAKEADSRRERGDELGPPPTPTPAPKRRYESTQTPAIRQIAPSPHEHKSPLQNPLALPKTSPPNNTPSTRFSTIAQAPTQSKPLNPASGYALSDSNSVSVPSLPQRQSSPPPPQRQQSSHHQHHGLAQHKSQHVGPRSGYFSDDIPPRQENRHSHSSSTQQPTRNVQQHGPSQVRAQEQHHSPVYRSLQYQDRESTARAEAQHEQEIQQRYGHHRQISQEMHHRPFVPGGAPPLIPPVRSNSGARSPEHRPLMYSHSRNVSHSQPITQPPTEGYNQAHHVPSTQQLPSRSSISTPPVKEEPRNPTTSAIPSTQHQPSTHTQQQQQHHSLINQPAVQTASTSKAPKPPAEPRKSNLMSLLNDDGPEEPRRKKQSDQGPSSHSTTPQQSAPIAQPPPTTQGYSASSSRRPLYDDPVSSLPTYNRPSYAQQSSLPPTVPNRPIDITNDHGSGSRPPSLHESWQRQPFPPSHSQSQQQAALSSSQSGLPQPNYNDGRTFNHRQVFAQHNAPRHNPSPPPPHSRTSSISGPSGHAPRLGYPPATGTQSLQAPGAPAQILQPNPYAQVDPQGSSGPPPGPMGMRHSPHVHGTYPAHHREPGTRNEHSQAKNTTLPYSNPQTPIEQPGHLQNRGPNGIPDPYRLRDPRDYHRDLDPRSSDRDTSRELSRQTDFLRDQMSNRVTAPSIHNDPQYQSHERGYHSQRSQTPLSRTEHGQPPPLQHPPLSSMGAGSLYSQRPPEEPSHRPYQSLPRDRGITERIREEHAANTNRDEYMRRDAEREMREMHMQNSMMRRDGMRGDMRGPPPPPPPPPGSGPGSQQEQRPPLGPTPDWMTGLRHPPQDRWPR